MSLREAFGHARLLTLLLLAGMGWIVFTATQVLGEISFWAPADIGTTAGAGVVGLAVLTTVLLFALGLFSGLGEAKPAPDSWPPENDA